MTTLPYASQLQFAGFVYRLSRTAKIFLRTLAVDLALSLLLDLPAPFAADAGYSPAVGNSPTAAPAYVAAPWSAVCLAALARRCADKAPAVRAKALANLGELVATFSALLAQDVASSQYAIALDFVKALTATKHMVVHGQGGEQGAGGRRLRSTNCISGYLIGVYYSFMWLPPYY